MKTPIIILIGTATLIVALVLGWVAFIKPKPCELIQTPEANNNTADTIPTPTPDDASTPIPSPDDDNSEIDTSDWLTYRNEKIGFELKYPKNYWEQIVTSKYNQIDLRLNTDLVSIEIMGTKNSNNKNYDFSSIENFKKWHNLYVLSFGEDVIKDVEKTTINQLPVLKTHEVDGIGNSIGEYIYFQNGESVVYFANDYEDNVSATMIFNQIISSFKFIK